VRSFFLEALSLYALNISCSVLDVIDDMNDKHSVTVLRLVARATNALDEIDNLPAATTPGEAATRAALRRLLLDQLLEELSGRTQRSDLESILDLPSSKPGCV
jgi:hypothetical protein